MRVDATPVYAAAGELFIVGLRVRECVRLNKLLQNCVKRKVFRSDKWSRDRVKRIMYRYCTRPTHDVPPQVVYIDTRFRYRPAPGSFILHLSLIEFEKIKSLFQYQLQLSIVH